MTMKRNIILILFSLAASAVAQEGGHLANYIQLDTIIPFHNEKTNSYTDLACSAWENEVIFTNFNATKGCDTVVIYRCDALSNVVDTLQIYEKGICGQMQQRNARSLSALLYTEKTLVIAYSDKAIIYQKQQSGDFIKKNAIRIEENYTDLCLLDDSTLIGVDYYYSHRHPFSVFTTNLTDGKVRNKTVLEHDTRDLLLSFFSPSSVLACRDGRIALTRRGHYSISILDRELHKEIDLVHQAGEWTTLSDSLVSRAIGIDPYAAADIIDLLYAEYDSINKIQQLLWIDNNTMAVIHAYRFENGKYIMPKLDIWRNTSKGWAITYEGLYDDGNLIENMTIVRNTIPLGLASGNHVFFLPDNRIAVISKNGCGVDWPIGMTKKDYGRATNDYLLDSDTYVQCLIFKHTLTGTNQ